MRSVGVVVGAVRVDNFPCATNGYGQVAGDHAGWRIDLDNAEPADRLSTLQMPGGHRDAKPCPLGVTAEVTATPPPVGPTRRAAATADGGLTARRPVAA